MTIFWQKHRLNINLVTSGWRSRTSITRDMNYDFTIFTFTLCQQLEIWFHVAALAPGKHLTMAAGVENVTFRKIELPITRVGLSVGESLSHWVGRICWKREQAGGEPRASHPASLVSRLLGSFVGRMKGENTKNHKYVINSGEALKCHFLFWIQKDAQLGLPDIKKKCCWASVSSSAERLLSFFKLTSLLSVWLGI